MRMLNLEVCATLESTASSALESTPVGVGNSRRAEENSRTEAEAEPERINSLACYW